MLAKNNLKSLGAENFVLSMDRLRSKLVDHAFKNYEINRVVHFAAESHVDRSIASDDFINTNIIGTYILLKSAYASWSREV